MEKKYWVPALEKAQAIIRLVAEEPARLKLTDLCKRLDISKSSMFSLLQTMEALQWLSRDRSDTYTLGMHFGIMGNAFFRQFDLIDAFRKEAPACMRELNESIQLASLEGSEIVYLAKEAAPSLVQMVSGPGTRLPAHATGLGKMLLSALDDTQLNLLYPDDSLESLTPFTLKTKQELFRQLAVIRHQGYALDLQEGVMGFNCIAVPIYQSGSQTVAAISFSMPLHNWEEKRDRALQAIIDLAGKLSFNTGNASNGKGSADPS
ncbi:IclR family transcriptional regulator [Paenibacillus piri]|uniref:IclR family transcriptional regulator n=1 Tax=Paenibacillus piri TaxID=2547395 RepID=A0A4R5KT90_9BACL|nr:IclR family transcriptional regulator [Paenibacillus piri]TDF98642.1 IclR family transcriptional regulator [Paenibacillus piri]